MSLRGRITLLTGVVITLFLALGMLIVVESRGTVVNNERLGALLDPVAQRADLITLAQVNAATALATSQQSSASNAREDFERYFSQAQTRLSELAALTESDASLTSLIEQARSAQVTWRDAALSAPTSSMTSDAFTSMVAASSLLERTLDEQRIALSQRESRLLSLLLTSLLLSAGVVLAVIGITLWGVHRLVMRPLARLRSDVQTAATRVTHPIGVSGPPEFQQVMQETETMRRALVRNIDEARHAREGLEQQAPLAAALAQYTPPDRQVQIGSITAFGMTQRAEGVVTGDWWDVFACDGDRVGFMVGDVSGHGDRAALLATRMRAILGSALRLGRDPAQACSQAQTAIDLPNQFATAVIGVIGSGSLTFVNAGHPEVLVMSTTGVRAEMANGPLICCLNAQWSSKTVPFGPGDTLLMFTDGLIEGTGELGQDLSSADLVSLLARAPDAHTPRERTEWILTQVRSQAPSWGRDDVTILCVQQLPLP